MAALFAAPSRYRYREYLMILTPASPVAAQLAETPVAVRLIGMLDRDLVDSLSEAFAALAVGGRRTLIVVVRDLVLLRDEHLERFLGMLDAWSAAGHRILVDGSAAWRKVVRGLGARFEASTPALGRSARRQVIICHSLEKRRGAA